MSTFFFPPSPTSHPLSGAVIYDPYRDVAGRNISAIPTPSPYLEPATTEAHLILLASGLPTGAMTYARVKFVPIGGRKRFMLVIGTGGTTTVWTVIDVVSKNIIGNGEGAVSATLTDNGDGSFTVSIGGVNPATGSSLYTMPDTATSNSDRSFLGDITKGCTITEHQANLGSLAPYSAPAGLPQSAQNYGIGSSLYNAQLGSAAGADTNDPTWGATGLVFGADDFLKITSSWFDNMPSFTCITAYNSNSYGGGSGGRLWSKANKELLIRSANTIGYYNARSDGNEYWTATKMGLVGANNIIAISHSPATPDIAPLIYLGTSDLTVTRATPKSGTVNSDAAYDMYIGNTSGAGNSIDGTIYLQVWFPRILTDAQYLAAYRYIKSLLAARGVTV